MKSNYNNQRHDRHSPEDSHHGRYDDFNILEPSADNDLNFPEDEEDELSDYTLMENDFDIDYDE